METLFGLPAHSLLIHAPIVLLPIAAIATVVLALRPSWRAVAGWWMVGGVCSILVMLLLARQSGEAFRDALEIDVDRHASLANTTVVLTVLWFASYAALVGVEYVGRRSAPTSAAPRGGPSLPAWLVHSLAGTASLFAILATIWLVRTGHEGADKVWGDTVDLVFR